MSHTHILSCLSKTHEWRTANMDHEHQTIGIYSRCIHSLCQGRSAYLCIIWSDALRRGIDTTKVVTAHYKTMYASVCGNMCSTLAQIKYTKRSRSWRSSFPLIGGNGWDLPLYYLLVYATTVLGTVVWCKHTPISLIGASKNGKSHNLISQTA